MEAQSLSTCNICSKKFQRKAHLLRHQQQHSGDRPYSCKFCSKTFKRSDVLRDHFSRCERRGGAAIPNSLERGRKRHACDECSRLKVKCDNNVPCRKCREFGRMCVKSRPAAASSPDDTPATSVSRSTPDLVTSDRNSIGFLLNGEGEADFLQEFPKSTTLSPNSHTAEYRNLTATRAVYEAPPAGIDAHQVVPGYQEYPQGPIEPLLQDNGLEALLKNLEFTTFERATQNWQMPGENLIPWSGVGADSLYLNRNALEERTFDIKNKLRYTANTMNVPHQPSKEVLDAIDHITADSLVLNIKLYFRHWHKHGPMVHEPTFNPCTAALPLVLAMMGLGGMYAKEPRDVEQTRSLFDVTESYIYSVPGLSDEYDLPDRSYIVRGEDSSLEWQRYQLEEIQGAYLMIVLQFWTGNPLARIRVRQQRFQRIVSIFHHHDMLTIQHPPICHVNDQSTFRAWIQRESMIRTATIAVMLDHAFGIFNNVSPRFQWAELDTPFPSDDRFFACANYAELRSKSLYPVGKMKVKDAYLVLFTPSESAERELNILRTGNLTPYDMQMLIHYLYTHVWKSTFSNPMCTIPGANIHEITRPFKIAMRNWRIVWDDIRDSVPEDEWSKLGFQRTGESYFEAVNSIMEVFERKGGIFPPIPSDCEKGSHLKRLLSF